ncbi:hypothetical protein [Streptomyces sp. NPDC051001]
MTAVELGEPYTVDPERHHAEAACAKSRPHRPQREHGRLAPATSLPQ